MTDPEPDTPTSLDGDKAGTSGGVNASAEGGQVNVGGDVTGRDKTVSAGTYVERVEMHVHPGGAADRSPDELLQTPSGRAGHYLDFEVEIGRGLGQEYPMAVIRSPAGEARETMRFPFDELALENQLGALQIALLRSGGARRQVLSPEEKTVQGFGRALFDALLSGEARSRFDMSCASARQQGRGLRLKLRIQPPELARLPWEFLYDPRQAEYVCLSRDTPVVRYLELPQPIQPLTVTPPLRILGMVASPRDLPPLNVDREKQRLEAAIAELRADKLIDLTWLQGQTWRDLQRAMRGGPWHIFHFIGHGGFDANADEGLIALTDDHGFTHRLMATELGRLLADHHSLRLALLNSCEGARGSQHDIFSSTAAIVVRRGLPAVLAMQYEITDRAAIEFSRAFYEALADGLPVDAAVAEARKAVSLAVANTVEWGTPVLYMRAPQGVIFEMPESRRVRRPTESFADADKELKQKLEQLYTDGLSAFWVEEWDKACRSFQAIVDARPDYPGAAAKLEEAQRQKRLSALYETAQETQASGDWRSAQSALETLVAEAADYKDASSSLRLVKKQSQLADLYAEARRLHAAQQWQAVVNVFAQIRGIEPDYADPDELLSKAEQEVAALKRQAELNELYAQAVREMDRGRWPAARLLLEKLQESEPGFRDAERLLAKVRAEITREGEEHKRQEQVATLYEQALGLARAKQWRQALVKMEEIHGLNPEFADSEGIAARAQKEVAKEEEEAQRQTELAALYAEAVRLLRAGQYQEALDKWAEVQTRDPKYRDRQKVQKTARQKLAALTEVAPAKRRLSRRAIAIVGGIGLIAVLVAGALWIPGLMAPPSVYDNFQDPAYDGSYNKSQWSTHSSTANVSQQNGVVALTADTAGEVTDLYARKYVITLQSSMFFEADLKLDSNRNGGAVLMGPCCADPVDTNCGLYPLDSMHQRADCWINKKSSRFATFPQEGLMVTPGSWHTFRIEFDRAGKTLTLFIDGQKVGSDAVSDVDLQGERSTFMLRVHKWDESPTAVTGYFDNVRIGPLEK